QIPHIQSSYRLCIGKKFGLRGIESAKADKCRFKVGPTVKKKVEETFLRLFVLKDLIDILIKDVNQQSENVERVINLDLLGKWAGDKEENNGFNGYLIFYDEDRAKEYGDEKPKPENEYKP